MRWLLVGWPLLALVLIDIIRRRSRGFGALH